MENKAFNRMAVTVRSQKTKFQNWQFGDRVEIRLDSQAPENLNLISALITEVGLTRPLFLKDPPYHRNSSDDRVDTNHHPASSQWQA